MACASVPFAPETGGQERLPSLSETEGRKLTSTQIRDRLNLEAQNNVGITFSENENKDAFEISGRG